MPGWQAPKWPAVTERSFHSHPLTSSSPPLWETVTPLSGPGKRGFSAGASPGPGRARVPHGGLALHGALPGAPGRLHGRRQRGHFPCCRHPWAPCFRGSGTGTNAPRLTVANLTAALLTWGRSPLCQRLVLLARGGGCPSCARPTSPPTPATELIGPPRCLWPPAAVCPGATVHPVRQAQQGGCGVSGAGGGLGMGWGSLGSGEGMSEVAGGP